MQTWTKPVICTYDLDKLSREVKAKAWSVESGMNYGEYIDSSNIGDIGSIPMEGNYGHTIQVECLGWGFVFGLYVKRFVDIYTGESYYFTNQNGYWERVF